MLDGVDAFARVGPSDPDCLYGIGIAFHKEYEQLINT